MSWGRRLNTTFQRGFAMANPLSFLIWTIMSEFSNGFSLPAGSVRNPLYGKHLRVIWPRWKGNPAGLSGTPKGGEILEYLSSRFNFTHEMVRVTENSFEPPSINSKGLVNYLLDGRCDFLVSEVLPTSRRLSMADLTLPWTSDMIAFLIPIANEAANINAVIKPFQWQVWLAMGISIICVIFVLNQFKQYLNKSYYGKSPLVLLLSAKKFSRTSLQQKKRKGRINTTAAGNQYLYVFGTLLSQGGPCMVNQLSFRTVAGAWALAAFVFVQAYQSTLFIYVMAPTTSPLINSVNDLAESTDINFIVKRGGTLESFFKNSNKTVFKKIQARIDASPRCILSSDCISMVTPGLRNVYADARKYLKDYVADDFKRTGKCNLQVARDGFLTVSLTFALPKNSPYTSTINRGVLELQEIGLIHHWDLKLHSSSRNCMGSSQKGYGARQLEPALSLKNLTGAFIVLLLGTIISLLAFIYERMMFYFERKGLVLGEDIE